MTSAATSDWRTKSASQTRLAFDDSLVDIASGVQIRAHHFAHFVLSNRLAKGTTLPLPPVFEKGAELKPVATGFSNAQVDEEIQALFAALEG